MNSLIKNNVVEGVSSPEKNKEPNFGHYGVVTVNSDISNKTTKHQIKLPLNFDSHNETKLLVSIKMKKKTSDQILTVTAREFSSLALEPTPTPTPAPACHMSTQTRDLKPSAADKCTQTGNSKPRTTENSTQTGNSKPRTTENSTQTGNSKPRTTENSTQTENSKPRTTENSTQTKRQRILRRKWPDGHRYIFYRRNIDIKEKMPSFDKRKILNRCQEPDCCTAKRRKLLYSVQKSSPSNNQETSLLRPCEGGNETQSGSATFQQIEENQRRNYSVSDKKTRISTSVLNTENNGGNNYLFDDVEDLTHKLKEHGNEVNLTEIPCQTPKNESDYIGSNKPDVLATAIKIYEKRCMDICHKEKKPEKTEKDTDKSENRSSHKRKKRRGKSKCKESKEPATEYNSVLVSPITDNPVTETPESESSVFKIPLSNSPLSKTSASTNNQAGSTNIAPNIIGISNEISLGPICVKYELPSNHKDIPMSQIFGNNELSLFEFDDSDECPENNVGNRDNDGERYFESEEVNESKEVVKTTDSNSSSYFKVDSNFKSLYPKRAMVPLEFYIRVRLEDMTQDSMLEVKVKSLGGEIQIHQVSPTDSLEYILVTTQDYKDYYVRTNLGIYLEQSRLDDTIEIGSIQHECKEKCLIIKEEPYSFSSIIDHIRKIFKIFDVQITLLRCTNNAKLPPKVYPETLLGDPNIRNRSQFLLPGSPLAFDMKYLYYGQENIKLFGGCLRELVASKWNPPPPERRQKGDILYLYVRTKENFSFHITGSVRGFYINKSTDDRFDPAPEDEPYLSQCLCHLLEIVSKGFKSSFEHVIRCVRNSNPLSQYPIPTIVFNWMTLGAPRTSDKEKTITNLFRQYENKRVKTFNEEIQCATDLPRVDLRDDLRREHSIFHVQSDFCREATEYAAKLIDEGLHLDLDKNQNSKFFIHNGISFEILDNEEQIAIASIIVTISRELWALPLEVIRLRSSVVIDYKGKRILARAIIQGMSGRKFDEQYLEHGVVTPGYIISSKQDSIWRDIYKISKELKIQLQTLIDRNGVEHRNCLPLHCGIYRGGDERFYMEDVENLFPSDPNFNQAFPADHLSEIKKRARLPLKIHHDRCIFRESLTTQFTCSRLRTLIKKSKDILDPKYRKSVIKSVVQPLVNESEYPIDLINILEKGFNNTMSQEDVVPDKKKFMEERLKAEKLLTGVCSIDKERLAFTFNPYTFNKQVSIPEEFINTFRRDEKILVNLSDFIIEKMIPIFAAKFFNESHGIIDGQTLTAEMHDSSINMRYLGILIRLFPRDHYIYSVCLCEIIVRSAKRVFREYMKFIQVHHHSGAISHFLNCFLSKHVNYFCCGQCGDDLLLSKKSRRKKKVLPPLTTSEDFEWTKLTKGNLWNKISYEAKLGYNFDLNLTYDNETIPDQLCLKSYSILRSFCRRNGIQLRGRQYDFNSEDEEAFMVEDITGLFPISKGVGNRSTFPDKIFHLGMENMSEERLLEASSHLHHALLCFKTIYGAVHEDIAACSRILGRILFLTGKTDCALLLQTQTIIMMERLKGIDCCELVEDFMYIGVYYFAAGDSDKSLAALYRSRYILETSFPGKIDHPLSGIIEMSLGVVLRYLREYSSAKVYLSNAYQILCPLGGHNKMKAALCLRAISSIYSLERDYENAIIEETRARSLFLEMVSDNHWAVQKTTETIERLKSLLKEKKEGMSGITGRNSSADKDLKVGLEVLVAAVSLNKRQPAEIPTYYPTLNLKTEPKRDLFWFRR